MPARARMVSRRTVSLVRLGPSFEDNNAGFACCNHCFAGIASKQPSWVARAFTVRHRHAHDTAARDSAVRARCLGRPSILLWIAAQGRPATSAAESCDDSQPGTHRCARAAQHRTQRAPVHIRPHFATGRRFAISALGRRNDGVPGTVHGARFGLRHGCISSAGNTSELDAGEGSDGFTADCQLGKVGLLHSETITQTSHSAIVISKEHWTNLLASDLSCSQCFLATVCVA